MHSWVNARTIFLVRHGSHAYGTNIAGSDLDMKGICIEPTSYFFGVSNKFEQQEEMCNKGHPHDKVIYSLRKFVALALNCNPNIIEVLNVDESDVLDVDEANRAFGQALREIAPKFLTKRAYKSFSGYAMQQLHRIKTHKAWLLNPPTKTPSKADFGLAEKSSLTDSEFGALDELQKESSDTLNVNLIDLFRRERAYRNAVQEFQNYNTWKKERNSARAKLEAEFGFDTKHGMHLIRLQRMALEILRDNKVLVKRPDAEELLSIRHGAFSYDTLMALSTSLKEEIDKAYTTSSLPNDPPTSEINAFVCDLTQNFLKRNP